MASIRVGDSVQTREVLLAALRSTGFLSQVVRRWGSDEVVRREDARRLRAPARTRRNVATSARLAVGPRVV